MSLQIIPDFYAGILSQGCYTNFVTSCFLYIKYEYKLTLGKNML